MRHDSGTLSGVSLGLVADYLIFFRGAERTFAHMADAFPDAPIHTIAYRKGPTLGRFAGRDVRTSYLQQLGLTRDWYRYALPLLPRAAESLRVSDHDVVVSSSFGFAHGVRPASGAVHVCYCHSPFRQAWHEREPAIASTPAIGRRLARRSLHRMRDWDLEAASRVTHYVANSSITRQRIAEFYGRDATLVYPPVEIERFAEGVPTEPRDHFLFVGALVPHKQVHLALEAVRMIGARMVVVGAGPELRRLSSQFGDVAEFRGRIDDAALVREYARAKALVVPNVEEFGIAAVEAQASGRPVVALNAGGAQETIVHGETGVLVDGDDPEDLAAALRDTDFAAFDPAAARRNAERFSAETFRARLTESVIDAMASGSRR